MFMKGMAPLKVYLDNSVSTVYVHGVEQFHYNSLYYLVCSAVFVS